jgi:hypothetical protein
VPEPSPSVAFVEPDDRAALSFDFSTAVALSPPSEVLLAAESAVFAVDALELLARLGFEAASVLVLTLSTAEAAAGEVVSLVTLRLRRTGLVSWISSMYVFALSLRQKLPRKIED